MQKRALRAIGVVMTLLSLLFATQISAKDTAREPPAQTVATTAALSQALKEISPQAQETVIRLQPGVYDTLVLKGVKTPVRLVAADPDTPPRITSLLIEQSTDLTFEGVTFDFIFDPKNRKLWQSPFQVLNSKRIVFDKVRFDGDLMRDTGSDGDGYPVAKGLTVSQSNGVEIRNSEIHSFYVGINVTRSSNIILQNSYLHGMRKDIITLAQVRDVQIENNHFGAYNRSLTFDDHPDMIQMWTKNTDQPSERVTVRGNLFNSGNGPYSQTIFMRNVLVDQGKAGPELFYRDLLIEDNVIINAHRNGLFVGQTYGLIIRNNTLIRNPKSERPGMSHGLATPRILVAEQSEDVVIENNVAFKIPQAANPTWTVRNNLSVQRHKPGGAGYYTAFFTDALNGDPQDLASFYYRKNGPLYQSGIGAPMLDAQP